MTTVRPRVVEGSVGRVEDASEIQLYTKRGINLVRGEGVYLWDAEGRRYLDAMSNYGVNILGHRHPLLDAALRAQMERLISCHQSFYNDARARFEAAFLGRLPSELSRLSHANSGAEAVEAAIKYARAATGRERIIAAERGYHGRTLGALSVTSGDRHRAPFEPLLPGCELIAYDDLDALERVAPGAAAVIVEPIQGEAGVYPPSVGYLAGVRDICARHGLLLILDEIQTGMGRTGALFAFQHAGVVPDILVASKGIAGGMPMGVTVVTEDVARQIPRGSHGSTFAGNPLACAAAEATLRALDDRLLGHVRVAGAHLLERLRSLRNPMLREARGSGYMAAVELRTRVTPYLKAMQQDGVLALPAGDRTIRLLPPLIMEVPQLDEVVDAVGAALAAR